MSKLLCVLMFVLALPYELTAQPYGEIDKSFGIDGYVRIDSVGAVLPPKLSIGPDQSLFVCFDKLENGIRNIAVDHFDSNGDRMGGYGNNGHLLLNPFGRDLRVGACYAMPDGSLLIAGIVMSGLGQSPAVLLIKLTPEGSYDLDFGDNGVVEYGNSFVKITSVKTTDSGKILVCGSENSDYLLLRFLADGTLDTEFGNNGKAIIASSGGGAYEGEDIDIQEDGKILIVGRYIVWGGDPKLGHILRVQENGTIDESFNEYIYGPGQQSFTTFFSKVKVSRSGSILIGGSIYNTLSDTGAVFFHRLTPDGELDTSFGEGGISEFHSSNLSRPKIHFTAKGVGYAVGYLGSQPSPGNLLLKAKSNGIRDDEFGDNGDLPSGVAFHPNDQTPFNASLKIDQLVFQPLGRVVGLARVGDELVLVGFEEGSLDDAPGEIEPSGVAIFPNPMEAGSIFQVYVENEDQKNQRFELYDPMGKSIHIWQNVNALNHYAPLALPLELRTGIYILRDSRNNGVRLMVQ